MMDDTPQENEREVCICFHVPLHKLVKFYRLHHPAVPSLFSQCYSAGTGCGWCIPFLQKIYEQLKQGQPATIKMSKEEYLSRRKEYHRQTNYQEKS